MLDINYIFLKELFLLITVYLCCEQKPFKIKTQTITLQLINILSQLNNVFSR